MSGSSDEKVVLYPDVVIPTVPGLDVDAGPDGYSVRYHPDPALDGALRQALADFDSVNGDARFRGLVHVDKEGAQVITVVKIAKGWSMSTIVRKGWTDPRLAYGVQMKIEL